MLVFPSECHLRGQDRFANLTSPWAERSSYRTSGWALTTQTHLLSSCLCYRKPSWIWSPELAESASLQSSSCGSAGSGCLLREILTDRASSCGNWLSLVVSNLFQMSKTQSRFFSPFNQRQGMITFPSHSARKTANHDRWQSPPFLPTSPRVSFSWSWFLLCDMKMDASWVLRVGQSVAGCRLESMARSLSREDGFMITVKVASNPTLTTDLGGLGKAPGKGSFSIEEDRSKLWASSRKFDVEQVAQPPVPRRLSQLSLPVEPSRSLLQRSSNRPLWESGAQFCRGDWPHQLTRMALLSPSFCMRMASRAYKSGTRLDGHPFAMPSWGMTPSWLKLWYGIMLMWTTPIDEPRTKPSFPKGLPLLSLAGTYHSNQAMKALLLAKANVNAQDSFGGNALTASIGMGNAEAVNILCNANINPRVKMVPGTGSVQNWHAGLLMCQRCKRSWTRLPVTRTLTM